MIKVNLLSPERKEVSGVAADSQGFGDEHKEKKINIVAIVGALVITAGIIGFMYITQQNLKEEKENLLDEKKAKKSQLADVEKTLLQLEATKAQLTRKVALIAQLKSQKYHAVKMMDAISSALPEWVWLSKLAYSGKRVTLVGRAIHNNLIADFINNLKNTNHFTNIHFPGSSRQSKTGLDVFSFTLSCVFQDKATKQKVK
ncbi:MAG: hypothetical protein GY765_36985 [bacterium]|nr:hypothetical protein [bacterium]